MKKLTVLTLAFLIIGLNFCPFAQNIEKKDPVKTENLSFDFSAKWEEGNKDILEVYGSIINQGEDTVYFLTSSCQGWQFSLIYDSSSFELTRTIFCNFSYPQIVKIAPINQYDFTAYFNSLISQTKMKLGFDICLIDQFYTTEWQGEINKIPIFNRPSEHQHILWAEEKEIK
jgi:hypothetical protein